MYKKHVIWKEKSVILRICYLSFLQDLIYTNAYWSHIDLALKVNISFNVHVEL